MSFIKLYVYNEHDVGFIFSKKIIIMYGLYTKKNPTLIFHLL